MGAKIDCTKCLNREATINTNLLITPRNKNQSNNDNTNDNDIDLDYFNCIQNKNNNGKVGYEVSNNSSGEISTNFKINMKKAKKNVDDKKNNRDTNDIKPSSNNNNIGQNTLLANNVKEELDDIKLIGINPYLFEEININNSINKRDINNNIHYNINKEKEINKTTTGNSLDFDKILNEDNIIPINREYKDQDHIQYATNFLEKQYQSINIVNNSNDISEDTNNIDKNKTNLEAEKTRNKDNKSLFINNNFHNNNASINDSIINSSSNTINSNQKEFKIIVSNSYEERERMKKEADSKEDDTSKRNKNKKIKIHISNTTNDQSSTKAVNFKDSKDKERKNNNNNRLSLISKDHDNSNSSDSNSLLKSQTKRSSLKSSLSKEKTNKQLRIMDTDKLNTIKETSSEGKDSLIFSVNSSFKIGSNNSKNNNACTNIANTNNSSSFIPSLGKNNSNNNNSVGNTKNNSILSFKVNSTTNYNYNIIISNSSNCDDNKNNNNNTNKNNNVNSNNNSNHENYLVNKQILNTINDSTHNNNASINNNYLDEEITKMKKQSRLKPNKFIFSNSNEEDSLLADKEKSYHNNKLNHNTIIVSNKTSSTEKEKENEKTKERNKIESTNTIHTSSQTTYSPFKRVKSLSKFSFVEAEVKFYANASLEEVNKNNFNFDNYKEMNLVIDQDEITLTPLINGCDSNKKSTSRKSFTSKMNKQETIEYMNNAFLLFPNVKPDDLSYNDNYENEVTLSAEERFCFDLKKVKLFKTMQLINLFQICFKGVEKNSNNNNNISNIGSVGKEDLTYYSPERNQNINKKKDILEKDILNPNIKKSKADTSKNKSYNYNNNTSNNNNNTETNNSYFNSGSSLDKKFNSKTSNNNSNTNSNKRKSIQSAKSKNEKETKTSDLYIIASKDYHIINQIITLLNSLV